MEKQRKILNLFLVFLTPVLALLAWRSVQSAVISPNSSTWALPIIFFSGYLVLVCLDIILLKELLFLELLLIGSLALSLFFAFSWLHLGAVLLSGYFLFLASRKIREDMEQNLKISIWKSLQVGKTYLLISFTFLIAMQYFFTINNFEGEKKVPHFDVSFVTQKIAIPFLSSVNPQFEALRDETLTVDQFILQSQADLFEKNSLLSQSEQMLDAEISTNLPQAQRELIKKQALSDLVGAQAKLSQKNQELILANGRIQFSEMAGVPLTGNEKIADVFTGLIDARINEYFNPKTEGAKKNSTFAIILAVVLWLVIYPVSSILSLGWFFLVKLMILVFLKLEILKINIMTVSKETIE